MAILDEITERAKSDLAWHAFVHKAAWWHRVEITKDAAGFLFWPDMFFAQSPSLLGLMKSLKERIKGLPSDNPGHYLNKQAVVYATAVLEAFLPEAYEARVRLGITGQSLNYFVKFISGKAKQADYQPGHLIISGFEATAQHACFLAYLRHVIVHNAGEVDQCFLSSAMPLRDTCIWRTEKDFVQDYQLKCQVCVDIDKVIIPYLEHAVVFVEAASRAIDNDLKARP